MREILSRIDPVTAIRLTKTEQDVKGTAGMGRIYLPSHRLGGLRQWPPELFESLGNDL